MVNLHIIEFVIGIITVSIAYIISTTLAGFVQAWVAYKLGDRSTAVQDSLTLNPLEHVDPIGALCLFLFHVGWGKFLPIDSSAFRSNWALLLVLLSNSATYTCVALIALLVLLKLFGITAISVALIMVANNIISLTPLTKAYPDSSSLVLAIALILIMLIQIGVLFAVLNFILHGFRYLFVTVLHRTAAGQNELLMFFAPVILMLFFSRPLHVLLIYVIATIAHTVAPWIGALA